MVTHSAAQHVDEARLWQRHMRMACHGATAAGGVNRQALSAEDAAAQRELVAWGDALGLKASTDAAGNLFLRLAGSDADAAPVMTGSHLDSQPTGGRFDGVYGVLAGFEAIEAILAAGIRPRRPIDIVAWMNEEGSRFAPGMMGSEAFAGVSALDHMLTVRDASGVSVAEALTKMPKFALRPLGGPVHAYIEAHIEQGPILERLGVPLGVVTGIQGKRTFRVTVRGEAAHAGTTPRAERRDALLAACGMVKALERELCGADENVMFTVGRLDVTPNAPSVIPAQVAFSIDLRHCDAVLLGRLGDSVSSICEGQRARCELTVTELINAPPLDFPPPVRLLIAQCARELCIDAIDIYSAAGHDARHLHAVCPAGMIFVPCRDGMSHNEAESADPAHLAAGARVLAECLARLAA